MNYYLSIDAGTSIVKVVIFDLKFKLVFNKSIKNNVITDSKGKSEINMDQFWMITSKCIKDCIDKSKINPQNILSVGLTANMVGHGLLIININLLEMQFYGMTLDQKKYLIY